MERRWVYSDERTNAKEFDALPTEDRRALFRAMTSYARGDEAGYRLEAYDGGIEMITDGGRGQGRCLYFRPGIENGVEVLTILRVYKKETRKAPQRILRSALTRRTTYQSQTDHEPKDADHLNPRPDDAEGRSPGPDPA